MRSFQRAVFLQAMISLGAGFTGLIFLLSTARFAIAVPLLIALPVMLLIGPWPKYVYRKFKWFRNYLYIFWPITLCLSATSNVLGPDIAKLVSGMLGMFLFLFWIRNVKETRVAIFGDQQVPLDSKDVPGS
jgi:hypothetical protein